MYNCIYRQVGLKYHPLILKEAHGFAFGIFLITVNAYDFLLINFTMDIFCSYIYI